MLLKIIIKKNKTKPSYDEINTIVWNDPRIKQIQDKKK